MRTGILKSVLLVLIAIIAGLAIDQLVIFQKSRASDSVVQLATLVNEFDYNGYKAEEKYSDRWVKISGELVDIGLDDEGRTILKLKNFSNDATVCCLLKENIKAKDLDKLYLNNSMKIRGRCRLVQKELRLEDCIII